MLREASIALRQSDMTNVELIQADAGCLPQFESETFDAITCAAGLLYMPVSPTLREWHRLLKRGGLLAFSTMHANSPPAARIFRDCAAAFGVLLQDASKPLGSVTLCRNILEQSGFEVANIQSEVVEFSAQDLNLAWDSNSKSAGHAAVLRLTAQEQHNLKGQYLDALAREERERPGTLSQAKIIYVVGRR
jgi:SAM-dependent methyltransferase